MESNQNDRLRVWLEQGNVTISQLFFQQYKTCGILDHEALLLLHLFAFREKGIKFPTPTDLSSVSHFSEQQITQYLQRLIQKGFLSIEQKQDSNGMISEIYEFHLLWDKLLQSLQAKHIVAQEEEKKEKEGALYRIFEQELGRLLSPMEMESIAMWLDEDKMSPELIKAALKEAVLAQKISLRYIDRILFEWKKKKITSVEDVEKHAVSYRNSTFAPKETIVEKDTGVKKVPFYNWLEERE